MSERARLFGVAGLLLGLVAGCDDGERERKREAEQRRREAVAEIVNRFQEADLKEMAARLQSNTDDRPYTTGLSLGRDFWVDEKRSRETTVRQTLLDVGATLRDGKVVDRDGNELHFYYVQDPYRRGSSGKEEEERRDRIKAELERLEKSGYHVIRMYSAPRKE